MILDQSVERCLCHFCPSLYIFWVFLPRHKEHVHHVHLGDASVPTSRESSMRSANTDATVFQRSIRLAFLPKTVIDFQLVHLCHRFWDTQPGKSFSKLFHSFVPSDSAVNAYSRGLRKLKLHGSRPCSERVKVYSLVLPAKPEY